MIFSQCRVSEYCGRSLNSSNEVAGAAHLPTGGGGIAGPVTAMRIEGFIPSVTARVEALGDLISAGSEITTLDRDASVAFWATVRDVEAVGHGAGPLWRLSVTPGRAADIVVAIETGLSGAWLYDWGGGLLWYAPEEVAADAGVAIVRGALAAHCGGHATLVRAPEEIRRTVEVFEPQPAPLAALSNRVKESFDPRHILNPGRMYSGV